MVGIKFVNQFANKFLRYANDTNLQIDLWEIVLLKNPQS